MATRRVTLGDWLASLRNGEHEPAADFTSALVEHLADAVIACDADGTIVTLNRRARAGAEGFPAHDSVPAHIPQERWAEYFQLYPVGGTQLLATEELPLVRALRGETLHDVKLESHGTNGARAVLSVSAGPVLDTDGKARGAVAVLRDVTER